MLKTKANITTSGPQSAKRTWQILSGIPKPPTGQRSFPNSAAEKHDSSNPGPPAAGGPPPTRQLSPAPPRRAPPLHNPEGLPAEPHSSESVKTARCGEAAAFEPVGLGSSWATLEARSGTRPQTAGPAAAHLPGAQADLRYLLLKLGVLLWVQGQERLCRAGKRRHAEGLHDTAPRGAADTPAFRSGAAEVGGRRRGRGVTRRDGRMRGARRALVGRRRDARGGARCLRPGAGGRRNLGVPPPATCVKWQVTCSCPRPWCLGLNLGAAFNREGK